MARRLDHEENFAEAVKKAYRAYKKTEVSAEMQALIEQIESDPISNSDSSYAFMVRALAEFLRRNDGLLPVSPSIPDMTATSQFFLRLQELYVQKATEDLALFKQILREMLQSAGLHESYVDMEEVEMFCRNAADVQCITTSTIEDEMEGKSEQLQETITSTFYDLNTDPKQVSTLLAINMLFIHIDCII